MQSSGLNQFGRKAYRVRSFHQMIYLYPNFMTMAEILSLSPSLVWKYFHEITQIPRPSKKEERVVKYLTNFAKEHKLDYQKDKVGNVVIRKAASPGFENKPTVVLQSHVDMVCEKNNDTDFNFDTDPIQTYIESGWVKARGTTLGGDDGIGVAAELALLAGNDIDHGPIECLFTVDEETGLTGAFNLASDMLQGKILLNLDSEDWGQLFIGCAGGVDTLAAMIYKEQPVPAGCISLNISVRGLTGGHSGDDIHKGRGNAIKILNRFLYEENEKYNVYIHSFTGGNLRNAIAREAHATVLIPMQQKETIRANMNVFQSETEEALGDAEPNFAMELASTDAPEYVWDEKTKNNVLQSLYACPHGVVAWSKSIENLVETSTNLASIKVAENKKIIITTSQRSSVESAKEDIRQQVASVFTLAGAEVVHSDGYPGWAPNPNAPIVKTTQKVFYELFNEHPRVLAIHAGLECGLFLKKYPELDMISFGPTIYGAHSPDERMYIASVQQFWELLIGVLQAV